MQAKIPLEINNHLGERIDFAVHAAATPDAPLVLLGHGITADKDRPLLAALARALAAAGFTAVRFSFAGNGKSAGRFEESTIIKEAEELGAVIDAFGAERVGYIGHSLGGSVGVLRAARDPRIACLITLAAVGHTAGFAEREFGGLQAGVDGMWGEAAFPLSRDFLGAMRQIGVPEAAHHVAVPWLLVHGLADDLVPPGDSTELCSTAHGEARLELIEGADHVFSGKAQAVLETLVVEWLRSAWSA